MKFAFGGDWTRPSSKNANFTSVQLRGYSVVETTGAFLLSTTQEWKKAFRAGGHFEPTRQNRKKSVNVARFSGRIPHNWTRSAAGISSESQRLERSSYGADSDGAWTLHQQLAEYMSTHDLEIEV